MGLTEWSKSKFGKEKHRLKQLHSAIEKTKLGPNTTQKLKLIVDLEKEIDKIQIDQESYWIVRSKVTWLK